MLPLTKDFWLLGIKEQNYFICWFIFNDQEYQVVDQFVLF